MLGLPLGQIIEIMVGILLAITIGYCALLNERLKRLRGTRWDVFGYSAERRRERQMIADYEALLDRLEAALTPANHATAVALAALAETVRGFGHVKQAAHEAAKVREAELMATLQRPAAPQTPRRDAAE